MCRIACSAPSPSCCSHALRLSRSVCVRGARFARARVASSPPASDAHRDAPSRLVDAPCGTRLFAAHLQRSSCTPPAGPHAAFRGSALFPFRHRRRHGSRRRAHAARGKLHAALVTQHVGSRWRARLPGHRFRCGHAKGERCGRCGRPMPGRPRAQPAPALTLRAGVGTQQPRRPPRRSSAFALRWTTAGRRRRLRLFTRRSPPRQPPRPRTSGCRTSLPSSPPTSCWRRGSARCVRATREGAAQVGHRSANLLVQRPCVPQAAVHIAARLRLLSSAQHLARHATLPSR